VTEQNESLVTGDLSGGMHFWDLKVGAFELITTN
jgi:hypothetical protein